MNYLVAALVGIGIPVVVGLLVMAALAVKEALWRAGMSLAIAEGQEAAARREALFDEWTAGRDDLLQVAAEIGERMRERAGQHSEEFMDLMDVYLRVVRRIHDLEEHEAIKRQIQLEIDALRTP